MSYVMTEQEEALHEYITKLNNTEWPTIGELVELERLKEAAGVDMLVAYLPQGLPLG